MVMRAILIALPLATVIVFSACSDTTIVKLTFVNNSDSLLCLYGSSSEAATIPCLDEVKPRATTVWRSECDFPKETLMRVVLTVGQGGREIYNRTAICNEWKESGAKFTIEQRGDELVVTDSLPDGTPSP